MDNRNRNQPFGLFGFPFFGPPQPSFTINVEDKENEVVIKGMFEGFEKENIKVEVVRTGVFIHAEQKVTTEEGEENEGAQQAPFPPIQRFVPIYFPFTVKDVTASFDEEGKELTVTVRKNEENRRFIPIE